MKYFLDCSNYPFYIIINEWIAITNQKIFNNANNYPGGFCRKEKLTKTVVENLIIYDFDIK